MWSFEGDYKKRPKQSFGGKSRVIDRQSLLSKLKSEREEREEQRRREEATLKIQAWCRGNASRKIVYGELRKSCDVLLHQMKNSGLTMEMAEQIISTLTKIFDPSLDSDRLLSICQQLVKEQKNLSFWICSSLNKWKYFIPKLVSLALRNLIHPVTDEKSNTSYSHAIPLRLLEFVSYPDSWSSHLSNNHKNEFLNSLFLYLLRKGYYKSLVSILSTKVPPVYESTTTPPNPIAESLLGLIRQPIKAVAAIRNSDHIGNLLHSELCTEVFGHAFESQVLHFVVPSLAASKDVDGVFVDSLLVYIDTHLESLCRLIHPSFLLVSILILVHPKKDLSALDTFTRFVSVAGRLLSKGGGQRRRRRRSRRRRRKGKRFGNTEEQEEEEVEEEVEEMMSGSDDDAMDVEMDGAALNEHTKESICAMGLSDLNSVERVTWILFYVEKYISSPAMLIAFTKLYHHICVALKYNLHECKLFFSVVLKRHLLLRPMWTVLSSLQQGKILSQGKTFQHGSPGTPLLQVLSLGYPLTCEERDALIPLLSTFSASLTAVLATLHDSELLGEHNVFGDKPELTLNEGGSGGKCCWSPFPFSVDELVRMSATLRDVCVGLVELAHPDIRMAAYIDGAYKTMWAHCFKVCLGVVRQIHLRDTRRQFCPEGHWLSTKVFLPLKDENAKAFPLRSRRRYRRFEPPRWLTKDELELDGPPLSVAEQRRSTLLQELPFVFPFDSRLSVFTSVVACDRGEHQNNASYGVGPDINVTVRRTHLYEDAFDKLSFNNEPNLRLKMRLHLLNTVGLDEVGIDGGGIFREFLSELLKTAFDPNRGYFLLTRDNTLYPNPGARFIAGDDFEKHYFFVGRMLGKALYENLLVEIPLAGFFLSKLLSGVSNSVEFHHLDSLDPELCKNLLSLKNFDGDIQDLGLDFTVLNAELGTHTVEELMTNGANISVTNENCIEYIYRMADYKLNKQIAKQCQAFKEGVFNVIESRWLRLFDWRELQMMVSGAATPIDIEGLKTSTVYSGAYHVGHPTILNFWKVVSRFDEIQCRQLLKFVTSCSRPPLLGFKELFPAFCIQPSGSEDRLPSASTCMNLLKLPEYKDENTLKEKLIYAITSSAGFELS